ncbi:hypothetical protein GCM10023193_54650 [Planotetraspora kaengkrachanensis]|uniref:Uncharacterized protein n=1 Tax=Planotetraspora kaengkrachanensis TaxID=575193 RepID=A0A8J3V793_9ACTN|nr:hypothetical protein Pka01_43500 [Planotetraspora kaengkrachanensis]
MRVRDGSPPSGTGGPAPGPALPTATVLQAAGRSAGKMVEHPRHRHPVPCPRRMGRPSGSDLDHPVPATMITGFLRILHNFSPRTRIYKEESGGANTARGPRLGGWKRTFRIRRYTCPGLPRWLSIWA